MSYIKQLDTNFHLIPSFLKTCNYSLNVVSENPYFVLLDIQEYPCLLQFI